MKIVRCLGFCVGFILDSSFEYVCKTAFIRPAFRNHNSNRFCIFFFSGLLRPQLQQRSLEALDQYGDSLAEMLQEDGIYVCFQYQESEATGTDVCIITGAKKYVCEAFLLLPLLDVNLLQCLTAKVNASHRLCRMTS